MEALTQPEVVPSWVDREYEWAYERYDTLAAQYPNQWVAFLKGQVLAAGPSLTVVLDQSRQKTSEREIPHLFIESGVHVY